MKVALVHDWLTGMRGGEYVLEAIAELFPRADLFTLLYVPGKISPVLTTLKRHTSPLQKVPSIEQRYRHLLPLMPWAIERFDLSGYDLIVSSSHCVAKGVRKAPGAVHVSYIHAPMRYIWDRFDEYFGPGRASLPVRLAAKAVRKPLQNWDRAVSGEERVDQLVSNSAFIARQVQAAYGRDSRVVYPFADLSRFTHAREPGRNYLMVTAFAPYKRVDLAVEAFNRLKLPLIIVGAGQEAEKLKKKAGPTVDFIGHLSNAAIAELYARCKAFIFPGVEDFGITPLEAMASGAPVIAYGEGGAAETVTAKTGVLFHPQTVEALMDAVQKVERGEGSFQEQDCRARAAEFSKERFQRELVAVIRDTWQKAGKDPAALNERIRAGWAAHSATL
ncbi:MAG: glycosyltransferase [Oligoflexia bacterium]|nr:glycosyltransferase [Oligoflexia bacterium]